MWLELIYTNVEPESKNVISIRINSTIHQFLVILVNFDEEIVDFWFITNRSLERFFKSRKNEVFEKDSMGYLGLNLVFMIFSFFDRALERIWCKSKLGIGLKSLYYF